MSDKEQVERLWKENQQLENTINKQKYHIRQLHDQCSELQKSLKLANDDLKKYRHKNYELKTAKRLVKIAKEAQEIQLRAEEREGQRESREV
jgi:septal ring factor EnvC (AmiA/AmiB activator)